MPPPQALAAEEFAVNKTLEITLNIPRNKDFRGASETERIEMYMEYWKHAKSCFNVYADQYTIEYCQDGMPHLHGYITFSIVENDVTDEHIVNTVVRKIFKHLPRTAWRQYQANFYNPYFKKFKSPAVCINIKDVLHANWLHYMHKAHLNAPKSS